MIPIWVLLLPTGLPIIVFLFSFIISGSFYIRADKQYHDYFEDLFKVRIPWYTQPLRDPSDIWSNQRWNFMFLLRKQQDRRLERLRLRALFLYLISAVIPFSIFVIMIIVFYNH